MNGYSKMKSDTAKSRSMDVSSWSPPSSSPETQNPKPETPETDRQQKNQINTSNLNSSSVAVTDDENSRDKKRDSFSFLEQEQEQEEDDDGDDDQVSNMYYNNNNNGAKHGGHLKLTRNSTVSASSAASHALQSSVMKAFSVKRSCSVSERYSRIHDHSVTLASDEDLAVKTKKKSRKSKIIRACKKLFGL